MDDVVQIYLSKPGGQREGPYSLAQIKQDLAAEKYQDNDYWAWHKGLPEWIPLYLLPGISANGPAPAPAPPAPPIEPVPKPEPPPAPLTPQIPSGMPFAALEHIFLFTTGDGPSASRSAEVARMLETIIGVDRDIIRPNVPRDVVGQCAVGELLKPDGSISDAVWLKMATHQPDLVLHARNRLYRVCVRTFRIEADAVAALVLFYNKQKL